MGRRPAAARQEGKQRAETACELSCNGDPAPQGELLSYKIGLQARGVGVWGCPEAIVLLGHARRRRQDSEPPGQQPVMP